MKEIVLITGAKGFIGQYVTVLLEKNYIVKSFDEDILNIDLDKYIENMKPKYLIHLAWETRVDYLNTYKNILFLKKSIELYEAFYKYGGRKAVFVGTEQEYMRQTEPLKENDPILPESLYAECKADLGKILVKYSLNTQTKFTWCRLFFIYGYGEKNTRLMPSIIKGLLKDEVVQCSCEHYVRDYINVEDVAQALCCCLFNDYIGAVNVAGGRATTIGEIATIIKKNIGGKGQVIFKTHEECNQPLHIQADISLLKSFGYTPKYSLEEGLKKEIEQVKEAVYE